MEPLLTVDDPDWASFKDGDESYYLRLAGEAIRRYCGWHIAPSLTMTVPKLRIGSGGVLMLPSLYVTDVSEVVVGDDSEPLDDDGYAWFQEGYIRVFGSGAWESWVSGGTYGFIPGGYLPAVGDGPLVSVTLTHGYEDLPVEVKQVAFELANSTAEMPSGNVRDIQTPGFRLQLSQAAGMSLNEEQRERLSGFKLSWTR